MPLSAQAAFGGWVLGGWVLPCSQKLQEVYSQSEVTLGMGSTTLHSTCLVREKLGSA